MNWKLFNLVFTAMIACCFMYLWYEGEKVSAWQPLMWVLLCFFYELDIYLGPIDTSKK